MTVPVLIVGAGPTGLTAAVELSRAGVDVRIVDRAVRPAAESRGGGGPRPPRPPGRGRGGGGGGPGRRVSTPATGRWRRSNSTECPAHSTSS